MEVSSADQARLMMAQSAQTMAGTAFWKALMKALKANESNALVVLEQYLGDEPHPDREEVMTLLLRWFSIRTQRRLLEENVEQAQDYRQEMKDLLLRQYMENPEQAVPEEV